MTFTTATDEQLDQLNLGLSERVNVKRGELVVPDINRQIELFSGKSVSPDHPKPERVPVEIGANVHVFEKWTLDDGTHIYSDTTEIAGPDSKPVEVRRTWYRGESALAQEVAERREWDPKREALGAAGQEAWDKSMTHLENVAKGYLASKLPGAAFAMIVYAAKNAAFGRAQKGQSLVQSVAGGVLDATGITGIYEGVRDKELFTGNSLNQTFEQRFDRAAGGVIEAVIGTIAGIKGKWGQRGAPRRKPSKPNKSTVRDVADELYRTQGVPRGEKLGEGGIKEVYDVAHDPDRVVAIEKASPGGRKNAEGFKRRAEAEIEALKTLEENGLPVVKTKGVVDVNGEPGILMEKVHGAQNTKDAVAIPKGSKEARVVKDGAVTNLNNRSIADLEKIRDTLIEKKLNIEDPQFLVDKDGRVKFSDIPKVRAEAPNKRKVLKMIVHLIDQAKKNLQPKKGANN